MIPIELTDAELDAVSGGVGNLNIASIFNQQNFAWTTGVAVNAGTVLSAATVAQAVTQTNNSN
jgi:hypothetical protein